MKKKIKVFLLAIIIMFSSFTMVPSAKATWPDIIGLSYKQALEVVYDQVMAALLSALKQAAIETINETVNNMISGTSQATSLFINDWEDYLFQGPRSQSVAYMNDFFTITARGKSSGNFISSCGDVGYDDWRSAGAKEAVNVEIDLTAWQSDYEEFACGAQEMFKEGTWDAYAAFMSPKNNPIAYTLFTQSVYEKKLEEKTKEAEAKALAYQGFKAQESENGIVITPGSIIEEITASANTISDQVLANASDVGEMAGIVVGQIASKVIKQGIGNARQNLQNEINNGICDASQGLRDELKGLTPDGNFQGLGIGSLGETASSERCVVR